jgi:nicotinamidase-related amidase
MNDETKTRMTADDTLLTPDNHALVLIDHQYLQLLAVRSHPNETVVNNTVLLAKTAKLFRVPTSLTTAFAERQALFGHKERPAEQVSAASAPEEPRR